MTLSCCKERPGRPKDMRGEPRAPRGTTETAEGGLSFTSHMAFKKILFLHSIYKAELKQLTIFVHGRLL